MKDLICYVVQSMYHFLQTKPPDSLRSLLWSTVQCQAGSAWQHHPETLALVQYNQWQDIALGLINPPLQQNPRSLSAVSYTLLLSFNLF